MILKIKDKPGFISNFLSPLNRVGDSCVCKLSPDGITTLVSTACRTVVVYGEYKQSVDVDDTVNLNIPDVGRLVRILQCIDSDSVDLEVTPHTVKYTSPDIRFTYHLLDDNIIQAPHLSIKKIRSIDYSTVFSVSYAALTNLLKSSTFTIDINKVYFQTEDGCVYAEINDRQSSNVDNIRIKLCDNFTGTEINTPLPVSLDTIRNLAGIKCAEMKVSINTELNVMTFGINTSDINMLSIVSGLIK